MTGTTEILFFFFSSWKSTNVFTATAYVTVRCKGVLNNNNNKKDNLWSIDDKAEGCS